MMSYENFLKFIKEKAFIFKQLEKKPVRIISHLDADGLSAAAILVKAFSRENIKFSLSIVRQLDQNVFDELSREDYEILFFVDLGSGYLSTIEKKFPNKNVFILDHHIPENYKSKFHHINPHLFNIDGSTNISGAGVAYLFVRALKNKNKDLAHIAIIGAIGDIQENKGFLELNNLILQDAIEENKLDIKLGLAMFGSQTRPLHKVLEYSTNPYIPGVTGSEQGSYMFLKEIGISPKDKEGNYKKLIHLDEEDTKKLVTGIILKRLGSEDNPDDILGPIYLIRDEKEESPTKDLREFSTLLNSCGRLNKPTLGIGALLNNPKLKKEAISLMDEYKRELIGSLNWFYSNRRSDKVIEKKGYSFINAEENIKSTLIGTINSMISKSNIYKEGTIIITMAHTLEGDTKISLRIAGFKQHNIDLREISQDIAKITDGQAGGHKFAAGCIIPQDKEEKFIAQLDDILKKYVLEERIK